jgi:hypothetical protein
MTTPREPTGSDRGREESKEWSFSQDPAVRTLLDHVAEELAAEFVRLMRASVATEVGANQKEKKR